MSNGNFSTCTVCQEPFEPKSDIVVCPECGAPAHRACYQIENECAFCHGNGGVVYRDPAQEVKTTLPVQDGISVQMITCKTCGTLNHPENEFCNNCGTALEKKDKVESTPEPFSILGSFQEDPQARAEFSKFLLGGMNETDTIDQVTAKDLATYVGSNSRYYLTHFNMFKKNNKKTSFSFSAFFAPPVFYLYRKMWSIGIITAILTFILNLPTTYQFLVNSGMSIPQLAFIENSILATNPKLVTILQLFMMSMSGIFANYLYMQKVLRSVKKIKDEAPQNYQHTLAKKGGVNQIITLIFFAAFIIYMFAFI